MFSSDVFTCVALRLICFVQQMDTNAFMVFLLHIYWALRMPKNTDELVRYKLIEEEGRNRASAREKLPKGDGEFVEKLREASDEMNTCFESLGEKAHARLAMFVGEAAYYAKTPIWRCESDGKSRADCDMTSVETHMESVDEKAKEAIGTRCSFLRGEVSPYTLSSYLNDLTACFHRNIEKYEESARAWRKEGKCMFRV